MRILIAALILVAGCANVRMGRKIDWKKAEALKPGASQKDVTTALGAPFMRQRQADGSELWMYMYTESRAHVNPATVLVPFMTDVRSDTTSESLQVWFRDGKMVETMLPGYSGVPAPTSATVGDDAPSS